MRFEDANDLLKPGYLPFESGYREIEDGKWVVASFTRTTGNVWSNPELTCQHVDPQIPLAVGASAAMETKLLVFQGSLHDVLKKVDSQRQSLR